MFVFYFLILIFFSAFFSCSEAALISLSDYKIRKIYNKNKLLKKPIKIWVHKPYRFIIAILIGNTVVNIFLSSFATKYVLALSINLTKELKELMVWVSVTFLVIIFGELVPKIIAKSIPEKIANFVIFPIFIIQNIFLFFLTPFYYLYEKYIKKFDVSFFASPNEIRKLITDSSKKILYKDVNEIFEKAILFNEIRVKEIMTPKEKVEMVNISSRNLSDIIEEIIDKGKTRVPLYEGSVEKIIGFALVKDVFYLCSTGSECSLSDIVHPIIEVDYNTKAKDLLKQFKKTQIHIAKVIDINGKFCGIITIEDVIEEVLGEILDEYDIRVSNK